jgi:hypothetical protein
MNKYVGMVGLLVLSFPVCASNKLLEDSSRSIVSSARQFAEAHPWACGIAATSIAAGAWWFWPAGNKEVSHQHEEGQTDERRREDSSLSPVSDKGEGPRVVRLAASPTDGESGLQGEESYPSAACIVSLCEKGWEILRRPSIFDEEAGLLEKLLILAEMVGRDLSDKHALVYEASTHGHPYGAFYWTDKSGGKGDLFWDIVRLDTNAAATFCTILNTTLLQGHTTGALVKPLAAQLDIPYKRGLCLTMDVVTAKLGELVRKLY